MMEIINENRETLALLVACLVLTGGNIWLHKDSPPTNWTSMEQYGIKFRHPHGYRFTSNTPTSWIPSYWDGGIQGEPNYGELEIMGFYWITDRAGTLERALDYIYELGKEENPGLTIQAPNSMKVGEYDVLYSEIDLETDGLNVPGLLAAFRDPYDRIILPYYLRYPSSIEHAEKMLKTFIHGMEFTPPSQAKRINSVLANRGVAICRT